MKLSARLRGTLRGAIYVATGGGKVFAAVVSRLLESLTCTFLQMCGRERQEKPHESPRSQFSSRSFRDEAHRLVGRENLRSHEQQGW